MPSYAFAISTTTTPSIQVYGTGISYNEILNSFGSFFYLIEKMLIQTNTIAQANEPIYYTKYDVNGSKGSVVVYPAFDPYGKQPSILVNMEQEKLVIDGRLIMQVNIFSSTWIRFTFFTKRGAIPNMLPGKSNKTIISNV